MKRTLCLEHLEGRALTAVGVANGVLKIDTGTAADSVVVQQQTAAYRVSVNGAVTTVPKTGVTRIEARLDGGNDTYSGVGVTIPQHVWGGAGSDTLIGGAAADSLYGGEGFDTLRGQNGNDQLFGEAGIDWLVGGPGADTYNAGGDNLPDRLIGVETVDTVHRDALLNVQALEVLNDHTNALNIFGETIEMTGVAGDDTLYRLKINGVDKGLRRAAGIVTIFADTSFIISPGLRTTLESRGLLRVEQLG